MESQHRQGFRHFVLLCRKEALRQDYTQNVLSPVIPVVSPIHSLQFLETGWDRYWAEPLSQEALVRANQLWRQIERITVNQSNLPIVQPAANSSVAFTWSHEYPKKELEIWL